MVPNRSSGSEGQEKESSKPDSRPSLSPTSVAGLIFPFPTLSDYIISEIFLFVKNKMLPDWLYFVKTFPLAIPIEPVDKNLVLSYLAHRTTRLMGEVIDVFYLVARKKL